MESDEQQIEALLRLIDDPDHEVYTTVANKILDYGSGIIPRLESLWERTPNESVQERLEMLIHRVHFQILRDAFIEWAAEDQPDLLTGALLIARYQYPDLNHEDILARIKKLERNVWLELNNYLTALEKINILNSMLYNHFHIKSTEVNQSFPKHFFINNLLESKEGNALSIGILYQVLCQRLEIPVHAIGLPRQLLLGYFNNFSDGFDKEISMGNNRNAILFFIDPATGQIFSNNDVKAYLKRLMIPLRSQYFQAQSNKNIVLITLKELSLFYKDTPHYYKFEDLKELVRILS